MALISTTLGKPVPGGKSQKGGYPDPAGVLAPAGRVNVGQQRGLMGQSTPDVFGRTPSQQKRGGGVPIGNSYAGVFGNSKRGR